MRNGTFLGSPGEGVTGGRTLGAMTESGESRVRAGPGEQERRGPPWWRWTYWWQRPRSAALDVLLAVASALESAVRGVGFARETGVPVALSVALGALAGAVLLVRRRWPIVVVLVGIAVLPAQTGFVLGVVGLYTLAASAVPRRIIALLAGMGAAGTLLITLIQMDRSIGREADFNPDAWFMPLVAVLMSVGVTAPPLLLGLYVGARRRLVVSLRERADGLERELSLLADRAEERAEWARSEERTRIAREMHDVVAHRVSLMVVHAAALKAVALKDPEKAAKNAALVGDMGRQALDELRTMLGVLRSGEAVEEKAEVPSRLAEFVATARGPGAAEASCEDVPVPVQAVADVGAGGAATAVRDVADAGTVPLLAELDALVGQSRAAGIAVELSIEGEARVYPAAVEQTAFRVVQEALTNVHKHAAGAQTRVRLAHREDEVALQVENDPAPAEGAADAGLPSGGNGLVGMKERVVALGGGFVSGPTDAGGFRVSAIIPHGR